MGKLRAALRLRKRRIILMGKQLSRRAMFSNIRLFEEQSSRLFTPPPWYRERKQHNRDRQQRHRADAQ